MKVAMFSALVAIAAASVVAACQSPSFNFEDGMGGTAGVGGDAGGSGGSGGSEGIGGSAGQGACETDCPPGESCTGDEQCDSFNCEEGECQAATCDDTIPNGDESGTDCGGSCEAKCPTGDPCVVPGDCEMPPPDAPGTVQCTNGRCSISCPDDTGDCNDRASDGCEVDLLTTTIHCGECDQECAPSNATGLCVGGQCEIKTDEPNLGCDDNYANCNSMPEDGCEVNLSTDPDHCGACADAACSTEGGVPGCSAGQCTIVCDQGRDDCNDNARDDGCEIDTTNNVNNCGTCDNPCDVSTPEYVAYCAAGVCGETLCEGNQGDCDGDGVCSDDLLTISDCGGCGLACTVANGTPACVQGMSATGCAVGGCDSSASETWEDCDGQYLTGCEVDTESSPTRCGGCLPGEGGTGEDCTVKVGSSSVTGVGCQSGSCEVETCTSNRADCDGTFSNGCEVNTNSNAAHCGGCNTASGINCTTKVGDDDVTAVSCSTGACRVTTCATNRADCDGTFSNGCEVNITSNATHCGGCAGAGGVTCTPRPHVIASCENSGCVYTCESGWIDFNGDKGAASGSNGCEIRDLRVLNSNTWGSLDTGGPADPPLQIPHTLQGAAGTNRMIVMGVMCRGPTLNDCRLTVAQYNGQPMTRIGTEAFQTDVSAAVYYIPEADLPGPGSYNVTITRNDQWGSITGHVVEFNQAEQAFTSGYYSGATSASCGGSPDAVVNFSALTGGTILYAVGGANSWGGAVVTAPLSQILNQENNYLLTGTGLSNRLSGNQSPGFDFTGGCSQAAMFAVGIRPATN